MSCVCVFYYVDVGSSVYRRRWSCCVFSVSSDNFFFFHRPKLIIFCSLLIQSCLNRFILVLHFRWQYRTDDHFSFRITKASIVVLISRHTLCHNFARKKIVCFVFFLMQKTMRLSLSHLIPDQKSNDCIFEWGKILFLMAKKLRINLQLMPNMYIYIVIYILYINFDVLLKRNAGEGNRDDFPQRYTKPIWSHPME